MEASIAGSADVDQHLASLIVTTITIPAYLVVYFAIAATGHFRDG
jgi:hypothetical protein